MGEQGGDTVDKVADPVVPSPQTPPGATADISAKPSESMQTLQARLARFGGKGATAETPRKDEDQCTDDESLWTRRIPGAPATPTADEATADLRARPKRRQEVHLDENEVRRHKLDQQKCDKRERRRIEDCALNIDASE